jgi:hypothetical protein
MSLHVFMTVWICRLILLFIEMYFHCFLSASLTLECLSCAYIETIKCPMTSMVTSCRTNFSAIDKTRSKWMTTVTAYEWHEVLIGWNHELSSRLISLIEFNVHESNDEYQSTRIDWSNRLLTHLSSYHVINLICTRCFDIGLVKSTRFMACDHDRSNNPLFKGMTELLN